MGRREFPMEVGDLGEAQEALLRIMITASIMGSGTIGEGISEEEYTQISTGDKRDSERNQNQYSTREQQFDLRHNLNQGKEREHSTKTQEDVRDKEFQHQEGTKIPASKGIHDTEMPENSRKRDQSMKREEERLPTEIKSIIGICKKCGKVGYRTEECYSH